MTELPCSCCISLYLKFSKRFQIKFQAIRNYLGKRVSVGNTALFIGFNISTKFYNHFNSDNIKINIYRLITNMVADLLCIPTEYL